MTTLICYDRCSTCQKAEKWLQDQKISYVKRPIKDENPSAMSLLSGATGADCLSKVFLIPAGFSTNSTA